MSDSPLLPSGRRRSGILLASGAAGLSLFCAILCVLAVALSPARRTLALEDKDCPEDVESAGGCHTDGNLKWKQEDVSERWATADWMNGYNEVTGNDVISDEYEPWADKLSMELSDPITVASTIPDGTRLPPMLPPSVRVVAANTVVVPTACDPQFGCRQNLACIDRWDWLGPYGGCDAYADWSRRMGWCENDYDVFGIPASVACPVSCDTCSLGM